MYIAYRHNVDVIHTSIHKLVAQVTYTKRSGNITIQAIYATLFSGFLLCRPGIHPEDSSIFLRPGRRSGRNQYVARRNGTPLRGLRGIYSDNGTSKMPKLKTWRAKEGVFGMSLFPIMSYHIQLVSRVVDVEPKWDCKWRMKMENWAAQTWVPIQRNHVLWVAFDG